MRIGLVLGAGGVVGQAYHAGVLAALEHDHGLDPRDADVIVGTSAGSITGGLLRSGVAAADLAAWTVRAPLAREHAVLRELADLSTPQFDPFDPRDLLRRVPRVPGPSMLGAAVRRPWRFRPMTAGLSLVAPGSRDLLPHLSGIRDLHRGGWPARPLWVCAVRRRDGRRVVFGRTGAPATTPLRAIAASCAVPGYFAPVDIGGVDYVDGGVHSPTNAALPRALGLDLVIVVAPMSGPPGPRRTVHAAGRRLAGRVLRREVRALEAAGTRTVVFRPGPAEQEVMGDDMLAGARVTEIVQQSFLAAGAAAAAPEIRRVLAQAAGRARVGAPR